MIRIENNLVVKSNDIIEARHKLDLLEQKIILYAVTKLDTKKDKFNIIQIELREFTELIDTTVKRYTEFREIAENLMDRKVLLSNRPDLSMRWLASCEYVGDGVIELEFSDKLVPYLLQLKERFTRYKLKNILYLKNKYSIRIYELAKQYEKIGRREFELEKLKQILGCDDKYPAFRDFNKSVLDKTKQEINEYTDIDISYEKITKGRKVIGIKYKIERKLSDMEKLTKMYDMKDIKLKCGLDSEKWSDSQVLELYSIATEKAEDIDVYLYVKLNYLKMIKDGNARSKFAYLKKSLEEDYAKAYVQIKYGYIVDLDGTDDNAITGSGWVNE